MNLCDTHCHLYEPPLATALPSVLSRARDAGVTTMVCPAYDLSSWPAIRDLAAAHPDTVHPALGLHPWVAHEDLDIARLRDELDACSAVAVGEIGLDSKVDEPDMPRQRDILTAQVDLALDLDLPVILHCRGAFEDLVSILQPRAARLRGVLHAFSRGPDLMRRLVDLGLHVGIGGVATRPRARRARKSVAKVPLERLLLETDAPSIGLDGVAPEDTEPRHVREIALAVAELRGMDPDELAELTTYNARELFGI